MLKKHLTIPSILILTLTFCSEPSEPQLKDLGEPGDFTLTDQDGNEFNTEDIFGQPRLIFFGFINCPDFCPQTLSKIREAYSLLPENEAFEDKPVVLFITTDPQRDTPEALKQYLENFNIEATGLTGTEVEIRKVAKQYGAFYKKVTDPETGDYTIEHSVNLYVMGPEGELRYLLKPTEDAQKLNELIQEMYLEMH